MKYLKDIKNKITKSYILFLILFIISIVFYVYKWEYRRPYFEINFLGLNRGRSVFIRTPENKTILIGAGQSSEVISRITKLMPFYNRRIDTLILPNNQINQIGGSIDILKRYKVGEVIVPSIMGTSTVLSEVLKNIRRNKVNIREVKRGETLNYEDDFNISILFPYDEFKFNKSSIPELAIEISYLNTSVFLLGNISKTIQKDIYKNMIKYQTGKGEDTYNIIEPDDHIVQRHNIIELYNSGVKNRVYDSLFEYIKPEYIFTTKEKPTRYISSGDKWSKIKEINF